MTDDEIEEQRIDRLYQEQFDKDWKTGVFQQEMREMDQRQKRDFELQEVWEDWAISRYGSTRAALNAIGNDGSIHRPNAQNYTKFQYND